MAVPPADDGELTSHPTDEPDDEPETDADPRSPRSSRAVWLVLTGSLLAVIVACLVVLGTRYSQDTDPDDGAGTRLGTVFSAGDAEAVQSEREAVMRQARQFVLRLFTYGPEDLEDGQLPGYVAGVEELSTPKFAVDFEEGSRLAVQTVQQARYGRTAEVALIGVRDLGEDAATVMVTGTFTSSYPPAEEGQPRQQTDPIPVRLQVSLVRTGGQWLVDDVVPVTTTDPAQAEGQDEGGGNTEPAPTTPAPTSNPTTPTTPAPSQGQNQGQGQGGGS